MRIIIVGGIAAGMSAFLPVRGFATSELMISRGIKMVEDTYTGASTDN